MNGAEYAIDCTAAAHPDKSDDVIMLDDAPNITEVSDNSKTVEQGETCVIVLSPYKRELILDHDLLLIPPPWPSG